MAKQIIGSFIDESTSTPDPVISDDKPVSGSPDPTVGDSVNSDDTINGYESFDPTAGSGPAGSGGTGSRRGRPRGAKNRTTGSQAKSAKGNLAGVEGLLLSVHVGMSIMFSSPELMLADEEAKALADAIARVAALYDHTINPRVLVWLNLGGIMCGIYGTRIMAIKQRMKAEKRTDAPATRGNLRVVDTPRPKEEKTRQPETPSDLYGFFSGGLIPDAM